MAKTTTLHQTLMEYIRSWVEATQIWRTKAEQDFEYVNGRQMGLPDQEYLTKVKQRKPLFFNEIRPQFELLTGLRMMQEREIVAVPRGVEDKRLASVASGLLKGTYDLINKQREMRRCGDDGDVCGLGVVEVGHTKDHAEDIVWGDEYLTRINPLAFIWDNWGSSPHFQDGRFMGKKWWISSEEFAKQYPGKKMPPSSEWLSILGTDIQENTHYGLSTDLQRELFNAEKEHVAIFRLYYREPKEIWFMVDEEIGSAIAGGLSEEEAKAEVKEILDKKTALMREKFEIVPTQPDPQNLDLIRFQVISSEGRQETDPLTGQPVLFETEEQAKAHLDAVEQNFRMQFMARLKPIKRKSSVIRWAEFNAFEILEQDDEPMTARKFPYRMYLSRQIGDKVEDIEGIVRQLVGRQDEITKRYNFLADHLAHSAHSGFFNKKGDGADTKQLTLMGTKPGVVVEYANVMPQKIEPSQIPAGHFTLLETNIGGIQRTTGINAELLGFTSTSTVSGQAISARQQGGKTMQLSRLQSWEDFEVEVADQMLYTIQEHMPVKKMRRILGVWEAKQTQQDIGATVFKHPVTGAPAMEEEILDLLTMLKITKFDLIFKATPTDQSERERLYQTALQTVQMVLQTGRPIGPETFKELGRMSELPERFLTLLEVDAQAMQQQMMAEQQLAQVSDTIKQNQARRGPNA